MKSVIALLMLLSSSAVAEEKVLDSFIVQWEGQQFKCGILIDDHGQQRFFIEGTPHPVEDVIPRLEPDNEAQKMSWAIAYSIICNQEHKHK